MKNMINNKSAISMVIVAVVVVIIVVAGVAGAYYYMSQTSSTNPTPAPSATATPSSTESPSTSETPATSPTESPSTSVTPAPSTQGIANFQAGAYANYTIKTFDNVTGAETSSMPYNWDVTDGTVNGTSVWVLTMRTTVTSEGSTSDTLVIMNVDKTTHNAVSGRLKMVTDGIVIYDENIDLASPQYSSSGSAEINPNTIVGEETITVAAGTFNCQKATTTDSTSGTVNNAWISSSVPIWGIVKMTTTQGNTVTSSTELVGYGP